MAKMKSNLFEQHVEKIVLGLCVLILLYVLVTYVQESPRTFEAPTSVGSKEAVPPDQVDKRIREAARQVKTLMDAATADTGIPDKSIQEIKELQNAMGVRALPFNKITFASPHRHIDVPPPPRVEKLNVAKFVACLVAPQKPGVSLHRELAKLEPLNDKIVAHVAGVFDYGDWVSGWRTCAREVAKLEPYFTILTVRAEVCEKTPTGWSSPRPVKFDAAPLPAGQDQFFILPKDIPVLPDIPEGLDETAATAAVKAYEEALDNLARWEPFILQPDFYEIWWPGYGWVDWRHHLPALSLNIVDDTGTGAGEGVPRVPTAPPRVPTPNRTPVLPGTGRGAMPPGYEGYGPDMMMPPSPRGTGATRTPAPTPPPMMTEGPTPRPGTGARTRTPGMPPMMEGGRGAYPPAYPPEMMPRTGTKKGTGTPAVRPTPAVAEVELPPLPELQDVPALDIQRRHGQIVVWFHDSSLKAQTTYQFRYQLEVANPVYRREELLAKDDKDFAKKKTLLTPFSEWCEAKPVDQPIEFFLTGSNPTQDMVKATVFAYRLGQYVKQDFNIIAGRPIGETKKVELVNQISGERVKREVDFTSGAVAVEFNFDVPIVRKGMNRSTVQMIYLDQDGQLKTRLLDKDREDKRHKELLQLVAVTAAPKDDKPTTPQPPTDRKTKSGGGTVRPPMMEGGPPMIIPPVGPPVRGGT